MLTLLQRSAAPRAAPTRAGVTILDCVTVLAIISILTSIAAPRASGFLDSLSVHGAVSDAFAVFSAARTAAVSSAAQTSVDIDTLRSLIVVRSGADTILKRDLGAIHQVKIGSSRPSIIFSANGIGYGAGNLTLVIRRGRAADSLFISRLGRVRH